MKIILSSVLFMFLFITGCNSSDGDSPPPTTPPPKTVAVDLEPTATTLDVSTSKKFKALATDENGETTDVTNQASWALVTNNGTVQLDTADASLVLAIDVGVDSVTASYGGVTSDPAIVTVVEETLESLAVTPADVTLVVTTSQKFKAIGSYNTGRTQDLTDDSTWESSNTVFVTMDGSTATAIQGTNVGVPALIKAQFTDETVDITSPDATVTAFELVESLAMTPDVTNIFVDQVQRYKASATFAGSGIPQDITDKATWSTSDSEVIAITSENGQQQKGFFIGLSPGVATITVSYPNSINETITDTKLITVDSSFLVGIDIRADSEFLNVGESQRYEVFAVNADDTEYKVNLHPNLTMSVSDPDVAYIEQKADGVWELTATGPGPVTVMADYQAPTNGGDLDNFHGHAPLQVNNP